MACKNCNCKDCRKEREGRRSPPNGFAEPARGASPPRKGKLATMIGYADAPLPDRK